MILLSNGGHQHPHRATRPSDTIVVGTVDGVACSSATDGLDGRASRARRAARSAPSPRSTTARCLPRPTASASRAAATTARRGSGSTRACDRPILWAARAGKLQGKDVVLVGALPAHLYISEDRGDLLARTDRAAQVAERATRWRFPPPPRIGHVKDIVIDGDRLMVGIEIGALLVSTDFGGELLRTEVRSATSPKTTSTAFWCIPERPDRILVANGIVGVMTSTDSGKTWRKNLMPPEANYPDAIVSIRTQPDLLFMTAGSGWPPHWYKLGRARGKLFRSRDAGQTWERLLGGLAERPARPVQRADDRAHWRRRSSSRRPTPTARFSRASMAATRWTIIADVRRGVEGRILSRPGQGPRPLGHRR